jgi:TRAP-type C4-dicarboxylate transport system substrate-binding protein
LAQIFKFLVRCSVVALTLLPAAASAEPIKLKLAFFSSDRSLSYRAAVKPFVDQVNAAGKGLVEIVPYFSGALGKDSARQAELVLDGTADIAYVVTGLAPSRFSDNAIVEMPGLFKSPRESTTVFTQLVAANALRGYEDYFVIGAYVTEPETIHSRTPISSIADLRGKRFRVNNPGEAGALEKLGALTLLMPVNQISDAISGGRIDGAVVSTSPLVDFGIKRVATYHYLLGISGAPLVVLMNRKTFEALPGPVQELIRKYSGVEAAERFIETYEPVERQIVEELKADPMRKVLLPSPIDADIARRAFESIKEEWAARNSHNGELLAMVERELAKLHPVR